MSHRELRFRVHGSGKITARDLASILPLKVIGGMRKMLRSLQLHTLQDYDR